MYRWRDIVARSSTYGKCLAGETLLPDQALTANVSLAIHFRHNKSFAPSPNKTKENNVRKTPTDVPKEMLPEIQELFSPENFYSEIARMTSSGASTLDSIVEYCARNGLEPESLSEVIRRNARLVCDLQKDGEDARMLTTWKTVRLPI
jgi:hypothetical protein